MRIRESMLRKTVRIELREQASREGVSVTGGGKSGLTNAEKREIASKFRDAMQKQLESAGLVKPGDNWSLTIKVGKAIPAHVEPKRGGVLGADAPDAPLPPAKVHTIIRAAKSVANDRTILDRSKLKPYRMLRLSISNRQAAAQEEEGPAAPKPAPGPSPGPRRRTFRRYRDCDKECIMKQQEALNARPPYGVSAGLKLDGVWGPRTEEAWNEMYPKENPPDKCENLPACKEKPPGPEVPADCPEGQMWDMVANKCTPIKRRPEPVPDPRPGPDIDEGRKKECIALGQMLWRNMMLQDNPLLKPTFYRRMLDDKELMKVFAATFFPSNERQRFVGIMEGTYAIMKRLWTCDCKGDEGGHVEAAKELIRQIDSNSDDFGNWLNPMQLFWRLKRAGIREGYNLLITVWNKWGWGQIFGPLPTRDNISLSEVGFTGLFPGFDPLSREHQRTLLEIAAKLDILDTCGPRKGVDKEMPPELGGEKIEVRAELEAGEPELLELPEDPYYGPPLTPKDKSDRAGKREKPWWQKSVPETIKGWGDPDAWFSE
jgi:hypothetical protein